MPSVFASLRTSPGGRSRARRAPFRIAAAAAGLAALAAAAPHDGGASAADRAADRAAPASSFRSVATAQSDFASDMLADAVLLMDRHFRVPETGQYLDALDLSDAARPAGLSSIAATGVGLVSLAIGDRLGLIADADAKAALTLSHLLNDDASAPFYADRSRSGWFRHWIDAHTGAPPSWNTEKFSTIDTAILAAGAAIAGAHFAQAAEAAGRPASPAAERARALLDSVDWATAIHDVDRATKHLVFYGAEERPSERIFARPFDEYALLPCIGRRQEARARAYGPASRFWDKHYATTKDIAMQSFDGVSVLAKPSGAFVSHFTHQFVFYLCPAAGADPVFAQELRDLAEADRRWFAQAARTDVAAGRPGAFPGDLWGLGAGSELVWNGDATSVVSRRYGVASLSKNPNAMASPAIMAGFLPVAGAPDGRNRALEDLQSLAARGDCAYERGELRFLWRCSARDPQLRATKVQAIDFSTYLFGFAAIHPDIGAEFFAAQAF